MVKKNQFGKSSLLKNLYSQTDKYCRFDMYHQNRELFSCPIFFISQVNDALSQFETALTLNPNSVESQAALYNKACCHAYR